MTCSSNSANPAASSTSLSSWARTFPTSRGNPINESTILAQVAAEALDEKKGTDIALLDVAELLQITEIFVIATGSSNRHVKTLADEVDEQLKVLSERKPLRVEGATEAQWVLLDYGDVVVHIFQEETREFYDLERLWSDAPRIAVKSRETADEASA